MTFSDFDRTFVTALLVIDAHPPPSGTAFCRALTDEPDQELDTIQLVLLAALATAHRRMPIRPLIAA